MGLLLENVDGRFASTDDQSKCEEAIRRLHGMGLIHGDINRYNFLIESSSGRVRIVDFEHVEDFDEKTAHEELKVLPFELAEISGGGPTREIV
jgi:tRNA A-37 threonylcarbamoyl transferase component Bud32